MTRKGQSKLIVATVLATVTLNATACSSGPANSGQLDWRGLPGTSTHVALQPRDLSADFEECQSAGVSSSISDLEPGEAFSTADAEWTRLKAAGVLDDYVAVYAKDGQGCEEWIRGEAGRLTAVPNEIASSLVLRFADAVVAAAAYKDDLLGQSRVTDADDVDKTLGERTGLGTNSVVAVGPGPASIGQVIWQHGPFLVIVKTESLSREQLLVLANAMDGRM